jgi:hypothetical protein
MIDHALQIKYIYGDRRTLENYFLNLIEGRET